MKIYLVFFCIFCSLLSNASHIAGGNITYRSTGITNEFVFTANVFTNCIGQPLDIELPAAIKNICGNASDATILLRLISLTEISQVCSIYSDSTSCVSPALGNEEGRNHYVYEGIYQLPANCNDWTISISIPTRNISVNTAGGNFYIKSKLDNLNFACNSSPVITKFHQIPYVCVNESIDIHGNYSDPDGDSLVYSLISALNGPGAPITYTPPATAAAPIFSILIDPNSGSISFTPMAPGNYTIAILIEEFDDQGTLKGSVIHDFQVVARICTNQAPMYDGTFNFDNLGTNASFSQDTISIEPTDEFCFEVHYSDLDVNAVLENFTNVQEILPNAVVTSTPGNPAIIKICWDFDQNYTGTTFYVETSNNTCPVPGIASHIFHLSLPPMLTNLPDTIPQCNVTSSISFECAGSNLLGWKDVNGNPLDIGIDISCNPCNDPEFLFTTDTTITVYSFAYPSIEQSLFIEYVNLNQNILDDTTIICMGDSITFIGPYPNHIETWSNVSQSFVQNSITVNNLSPATLFYNLSAYSYCSVLDSTILMSTSPSVTISTSSATLISNTHITYQWLLNNAPIAGETNQSHFPIINGNYSVIGYDIWNCSDTSNVIEITSAGIDDNIEKFVIMRSRDIVSVLGINETAEIEIFDIQGRLIIQQSIINSQAIVKLPSENQIYIARITSAEGEIIATKKL